MGGSEQANEKREENEKEKDRDEKARDRNKKTKRARETDNVTKDEWGRKTARKKIIRKDGRWSEKEREKEEKEYRERKENKL